MRAVTNVTSNVLLSPQILLRDKTVLLCAVLTTYFHNLYFVHFGANFFADLTTPFQGNVIRLYLAAAKTVTDVLKIGDILTGMQTRCLFRKKKKEKMLTANWTTISKHVTLKLQFEALLSVYGELSWAADSYSFGWESTDSVEPWYSLPCVTKPCRSICPNSEECILHLRIYLKINIIVALPTGINVS